MTDKTLPPVFQNPQADGGSFYWKGSDKNSVAVLLFHGFTATTVEVRPMAKYLHKQGFSVAGPLLPGHGVSPEELNQTEYVDWMNSAENAYQELRAHYSRIFIIGESMGGLCALWLGSLHPEIDGLLLFAPAMKIPRLWQANLVWPFVKTMYKKNIDLNTTWQGFNVVPMRAASQLNKYQQRVKKNLSKVTSPALVFQGKLDGTIDPFSSVIALKGICSEDKELVWLEDSGHCILLDKQIDVVKELSLDFIHKHS